MTFKHPTFRELVEAPRKAALEDAIDAICFRFWIRAAAQYPGDTARALAHCQTPEDYRRALIGLAQAKGVNLPGGDR